MDEAIFMKFCTKIALLSEKFLGHVRSQLDITISFYAHFSKTQRVGRSGTKDGETHEEYKKSEVSL